MTHYLLGLLVSFDDLSTLPPLVESVFQRDPRHPRAVHNLAVTLLSQGKSAEQLADYYLQMDLDKDANFSPVAVNWIGQTCFNEGFKRKAATKVRQPELEFKL